MKKCAIVTLYANSNYGNKLQNYAVQYVLDRMGLAVTTLRIYDTGNCTKFNVLINFMKTIKLVLLGREYKNINFKLFDKRFMLDSKKRYYYNRTYNKLANQYDYFILGSDQVWNPYFGLRGQFRFCDFTNGKSVIPFAASIGVDTLPKNNTFEFSKNLSRIPNISVRENQARTIIQNINENIDAEVLIDPTMLLSSSEWNLVSKKPKALKSNKFILTYFLGKLSKSRFDEINKIAVDNGCELINILDKNSPFYECGPSEFLYLEKYAFLICTDSFHSSVFGILYNTPFIVYNREDKVQSMNSRLETLLKKFKLEDRKYTGKIRSQDLKLDCTEAYKVLEIERKKSNSFLRKALNIGDDKVE